MMKTAVTHLAATLPDTERMVTAHPPSDASLSLSFSLDDGMSDATTRLIERQHYGPLRVQKPLYPEGPRVCHAIIVHPPGGVVGGDRMAVTVTVGAGAQALLTTPGAAKWYRANGRTSRQSVALHVATGATLEWLPQETIFFNDASVHLRHEVSMAADAGYIGSEILCFGRTAAGEVFNAGHITQCTTIRRDGRMLWFEQGSICAGSSSMRGVAGLGEQSVCATMIAVGSGLSAALVGAIRADAAQLAGAAGFGVTLMKTVLVARYLGTSSADAKTLISAAWQQVRPALTGRAAAIPRIWNT